MLPNIYQMPIVHSGAPYRLLVDLKPKLAYQMQRAGRGCCEAGDIARVGRDLGLHKNDLKRLGQLGRAQAQCLVGCPWHVACSKGGGVQQAIRKLWLWCAALALGGCGGRGQSMPVPVGVSTATRSTPSTPALLSRTQGTPALEVAPAAPSDWSTGLQLWEGSSGRTHLYGEPTASWATYANVAARTLLDGAVRSAPSGSELVAKVVSNTAGTAWLRMRKVQSAWVYDALDNGEPAGLRAMSTCASCHVQSSADSVYFSPTK